MNNHLSNNVMVIPDEMWCRAMAGELQYVAYPGELQCLATEGIRKEKCMKRFLHCFSKKSIAIISMYVGYIVQHYSLCP